MNKVTLSIVLVLFMQQTFSQKLIQLHPLFGDTIDNTEKMVFYLFPEIKDADFEQGLIFLQDSAYFVNVKLYGQEEYLFQTDSSILNEYQKNIEKLVLYYSKLSEIDSTKTMGIASINSSMHTSPEFKLNAEQRKKLVKDSRRYWRKKDKAEDLGLWGVDKENYIKSSSHTNVFKGKVRF